MNNPNPNVVVPLDGSNHGERALPWAVTVAGPEGHVQLIHVIYTADPAFFYAQHEDALAKQGERYLEDVAGRIGADVGPVGITVERGRPGPSIVEQARRIGADLIVLTSHGRGPLSRFWLGSTADYVMRESAVPVLVVRPDEIEATKATLPDSAMILLDGSREAERALLAPELLRLPTSTELVLVRVLTTPYVLAPPANFGAVPIATDSTAIKREREAAEAYVATVAKRLSDRGYANVRQEVIASSTVGAAAVDLAKERDIPLIALTSHGRGGVGRLVMGSVADKVVRAGGPFVLVFGRDDD